MQFSGLTLLVYLVALGEDRGSHWWDYPGLEFWKFVNLLIFGTAMAYILRRPLSDALRSRRDGIRRDLLRAQEERDQALAKLAELESRLALLDSEVENIQLQARVEAEAERERIMRNTEAEIAKLRDQAQREIESAGKIARHELQRFAARQSVKLAEEQIRRQLGPEDEARLIRLNVEEFGRRGN